LKIRFRESTDRYNIINSIGFVGAYQLGAVGLVDLGYVNADIGRSNAKLKQDSYWKGKNGIKSLQNFFDNPSEQDNACRNYFRINFGYLKSKGAINENTTKKELCGLLAAAHLVGAGGASNLVKGNVKKDANGVSAQQYYDLGYSAISGDLPIMPPSTNPAPVQEQTIKETAADKTATSQIETLLKTKFGFKDPNGMYPLLSHIGEPDTNRLARHQNIAETIIPGKIQEQLHSVPMANNRGSWDQSDIPFNAIYPFNHVTETESGHIMEFDDTPGCERINMHHTSGTFSEIDANGTQVNRIVGDSFVIMERHGYVNISGDCIIHVEGNANIYVENDADIQVDGDVLANLNNNLDANVAGKMNLNVTEELQIKAKQINMQTHTGSINFDSAAQINSLAATSIMNQAGSVIRSSASGAIDIQSGEDFSVDAVNVQLNSGTSSAADVGNPATTLLVGNVRADVIAPVFDDLTLPNYIEEKDISVYEDATPAAIDDHIQQKLEKKELSQADFDQMEADKANPPPALKVDSTPTTPQKGIAVPTPASSPDGTYPKSLRISPHYTLQDLTGFAQSPKILVPQHGRSVEQLVANMTALAINCLEPIKKAYPNMKLNSCLRSVGNAFSKSGGTPSQHELGMAADMKFEGYDVYDVVLKLKDLIPYDQLILEYSNNYSSRWIHVSFNSISNRNMNFTMNNGKTFPVPGAKGYKKLA
jgi:hypothetical protein